MKKLLILFFLIAPLCAIGTACQAGGEPKSPDKESGQNEVDATVLPVNVGDELSAFFNENLEFVLRSADPAILGNHSLKIGSLADLPKVNILSGEPFDYPDTDIDFGSHTIIIGSYPTSGDGLYSVESQSAVIGSSDITINATIKIALDYDHLYLTTGESLFWGIYPKLPNKPITVIKNLIKEQP